KTQFDCEMLDGGGDASLFIARRYDNAKTFEFGGCCVRYHEKCEIRELISLTVTRIKERSSGQCGRWCGRIGRRRHEHGRNVKRASPPVILFFTLRSQRNVPNAASFRCTIQPNRSLTKTHFLFLGMTSLCF